MIHVYESVTRDKEKCALSALTDVCIRHIDFSEKKNEVFFGTDEIVRYIHCTGVSRAGVHCTRNLKKVPF